MLNLIQNLIQNLINSEWFYIYTAIWLLISIASKSSRNELLFRLNDLITKPVIFSSDDSPESVPFYPRRALERVAMSTSDALTRLPKETNVLLRKFISSQIKFIIDPERPWKAVGYGAFLILFFFFSWADAIAIANALDALGLLSSMSYLLRFYEITVAFGSFFSIVVGALVVRELYSEQSDFSDWDEQIGFWKQFAKTTTVMLIISGFLVMLALGLGRYERLGLLSTELSGTISIIVNSAILILVPLNTVVATLLIYHEAIKGLMLVLVFVEVIMLSSLNLLLYIAEILGAFVPFAFDIIYRLMLMLIYMSLFFLLTPLDWIARLMSSPQNKK